MVMAEHGKTIYFDMDGTIADLYGVNNWLAELRAANPAPYEEAEPLVNFYGAASIISKLEKLGYKFGVISWLSKNSQKEYDKKVRKAKTEWLQKNVPLHFDEIHIVKYGTRKDYIAKDKYGILFDDDERVREKWRGLSFNPCEVDILKKLEELST